MPLVSVLMPVHNHVAYLQQAIKSILVQTHRDIELLVVVDGSTEPVAGIIARASRTDPRLKWWQMDERMGLAVRLNQVLLLAKGDFIARQDSDDWSDPQRIEKQMAAFAEGVGLVGCWGQSVSQNGDPIPDIYMDRDARPKTNGCIRPLLDRGNCLVDPSCVYSRAAVEAVGLFDEACVVGQTYNYNVRVARQFVPRVVPEVLYYRRVHPQQYRRTARADKPSEGWKDFCLRRAAEHPVIRAS